MAVLDQSVPCYRFFEEISAIPHGSHNEQAISDYLVRFAKQRKLTVRQEPCGNVVMYAAATPGYEAAPAVMLQAHMDMVCEKEPFSMHDFQKDALQLYVDDGWLKSRDTTLGADDGCGVAMILSVLDDPGLRHPRLECVFTVAEETGMDGAQALDVTQLQARRMICLDATGEKVVLTTSAGGCRASVSKNVRRIEKKGAGLRISIGGLLGGHSGMYIAAGRGNAIKLLGRLLAALEQKQICCELVSVSGGAKDNAIPANAAAEFLCDDIPVARQVLDETFAHLSQELAPVETGLKLDVCETELASPMECKDAKDVLALMRLLPDGVSVMSRHVENLPQTSDNLGVLSTTKDSVEFEISLRSAGYSEMQELADRITLTAQVCRAQAQIGQSYPAMAYLPESEFRSRYASIMRECWHTEPVYLAVHAGSEVGYFAQKLPEIEIVTLGPFMEDVHSPKERLNLASFRKCTEFLAQVLERLDR